jgi:hypothetical protein
VAAQAAAQPKTTNTVASAPAPSAGAVTIRVHGGADVLLLQPAADGSISLDFTEGGKKTHLVGKMSDPAKRKYRSGETVVFETKWDEDGFKLRTPTGSLLSKVKIKDDKIKVSDNEENANPFELKSREGDRIKVMGPGEKELGNVRATVVEDTAEKKLFDITGRAGSAGYGVLLLDKIPAAQRYIILSELFAKGK